jgi:hypothetical protein
VEYEQEKACFSKKLDIAVLMYFRFPSLIFPAVHLGGTFFLLSRFEIGAGFIGPLKDDFARIFLTRTQVSAYIQISLCEVLTVPANLLHI